MITRKNHGAPSSTTPGNVGDYYIDIDTGKVYQCVDVTTQGDDLGFVTVYANGGNKNTVYVWKSTGASSYNELEDKPFGEEIKENTVTGSNMTLPNFPAFAVGDTVNVTVDGVEYSLVAYKDETIIIGDSSDDLAMQRGELGWQIWCDSTEVHFYSEYEHTVSYSYQTVKTIDPKYLPETTGGGQFVVTFAHGDDGYTIDKTREEIAQAVEAGCEVVAHYDASIGFMCRNEAPYSVQFAFLTLENGGKIYTKLFNVETMGDEVYIYNALSIQANES